ncbi:RdRP-domain-containing protein [Dentipellis sp. KUC8613]|nr:RdRP-domain-containing protein [Dentipellis sp. KUC8613]
MPSYLLRETPTPEDTSWVFTNIPAAFLAPQRTTAHAKRRGKLVIFTPEKITLELAQLPGNRIVYADDADALVLASFERLRFPDAKPSVATEYMVRLFRAGLFLNGVQYRFYGHSNSQQRSRGCFLRQANSDEELDRRLYAMGDLEKIMNVAKRAKRIGLLFSGAEIDYQLDPKYVGDIGDLTVGDENFSDGCGLISKRLCVQVSRAKRIIFQGKPYSPTVFQIRYRGYKGVVMLHPPLDAEKKHLVEFRKSMKKFNATADHIFSVVNYSTPYSYGRLNNDIVVLLSSLGVTNEALLKKQAEYFSWVEQASRDVIKGFEFLSSFGRYPSAERLLLIGIDSPAVQKEIKSLQKTEVASFYKDGNTKKERVRMLVHKSRRLFGVCDPFRVLQEGQVHVRITVSRNGASTVKGLDVIVVRNPCLHPGDILKLRAVDHPQLSHLVDCVVFPSVGKRAAPSMSSGGDLDGDEYFVCWDPELVPSKVLESYGYPPNKERVNTRVTREDLARHFASYNNSGMARSAALHNKWASSSPEGALSKECQELNALYSQAVDGARIQIPDRLKTPPAPKEDFVLSILFAEAQKFSERFVQGSDITEAADISRDTAEELILRLLSVAEPAVSEYALLNKARAIARQHQIDFTPYLSHINFGALLTSEKYELGVSMNLAPAQQAYMWNSLLRSDILTASELADRKLGGPLRVQRLYSSKTLGLYAFFEYLERAMDEYTRKLIIFKLDDRFSVVVFIRGKIPWNEDVPVDGENVVVASFMKESALAIPTYKACTTGFRLHCSEGNLQLFNQQRANTFIFLSRPPALSGSEIKVSIALQQISARVQRQMGRVNRTPVVSVEIHVVSNRDRVAHQLFDLRFEHIATEEFMRRFTHQSTTYQPNTLEGADLTELLTEAQRSIFTEMPNIAKTQLSQETMQSLDICADFAWKYHADDQLFWIFDAMLARLPLDRSYIAKWLQHEPLLVFSVLKRCPPMESGFLHDEVASFDNLLTMHIVRSANAIGIAALVAFEKIQGSLATMHISHYLELLEMVPLCVRSPQLVQEMLFVLNECRASSNNHPPSMVYAHKQALGVAFDRAEEAGEECPCDEQGRPKKQRTAPALVPLHAIEGKPYDVIADIRVDSTSSIRLHSHVRLRAASKPEKGHLEPAVLDGVVGVAKAGEVSISLMHTPPPEFAEMHWYLYNAGSVATFRAMMDAIRRLAAEGAECCRFHRLITAPKDEGSGAGAEERQNDEPTDVDDHEDDGLADERSRGDGDTDNDTITGLNASQMRAVQSSDASRLSLIWGPPGTGKTTVVVQILKRLVKRLSEGASILMTASTHNAVDNVLERFVKINRAEKLVPEERILRVATDSFRVNKALHSYTVESRVGGEILRDSKRRDKAEKLVKAATIIFTTCAGAGLGILRGIDFDIALIDEAVQLRPMVRPLGHAVLYDVSLFERLYTGRALPGIERTMLDVQYRFPKELAAFPSKEFYDDKLQTGVENVYEALAGLLRSTFPWPRQPGTGRVQPAVFVPCSSEEDYGGRSKSNEGQARLVKHIVQLLSTDGASGAPLGDAPSIAVLSPYTKQTRLLQRVLPAAAPAYTIDSFQGRESDVVVFSTVRCNASADIGFVEDARRLNVAWTRARLALIVVGDRATMAGTLGIWKRAIESCSEVALTGWDNEPS